MTNEERVAELTKAIKLTRQVRDSLVETPPDSIIEVTPGQSLQSAIDSAPAGSTFQLAPGTYDEAIYINKSAHFIPLHPPARVRATDDTSVWLTSHDAQTVMISPEANNVTFLGIGGKNSNPEGEWFTVQGSNVVFDRCAGLGDPAQGQHRGWRMEGKHVRMLNCYADMVFLYGRDSAVIGSWQDCDDLEIDQCYFRGGAETIMFGGADSPSYERIPRNVRITASHFTYNPYWYSIGAQRKTPFELKCVENFYMVDCLCEYGGVAEGQSAYLGVLTVRNQDGRAPWSCIKNVMIERCQFRYGGGGLNILGRDDGHDSGILEDLTVRDCSFTGLCPSGYWSEASGYYGSGRGVNFAGAPSRVTLDALTLEGTDMGSLGYFAEAPHQPTGLVLRNWRYFDSEYGWKINDGPLDMPPASKHIQELMPDMIYDITANDPGAAVGGRKHR